MIQKIRKKKNKKRKKQKNPSKAKQNPKKNKNKNKKLIQKVSKIQISKKKSVYIKKIFKTFFFLPNFVEKKPKCYYFGFPNIWKT